MKKILSHSILFVIGFWSLGFYSAKAVSFPDVKSPILLEAVNYLNEQGIIKGYPDGTFKPDQVINRAEALKIIFESRGIAVQEDTNSGFPDVDSSLWFAKYVTSAKRLGLIIGYADGTYKPTQFVNKAEFMKIAMLAQNYYQSLATNEPVLTQFEDLDASAWYIPYLGFALNNEFVDRVSRFNPTAGMSRGEAALIIYRVAKYNEGLVEEEPEPLPYLSCETCVNGVDLSQYEWSINSIVRVEAGKLLIANEDNSDSVRQEGNTGKLTATAEFLLSNEVKRMQYIVETRETSQEEKRKIDVNYPDYYERILGINGGVQVFDMYREGGKNYEYLYRNKDGKLFKDCDCNFELQVINTYNGKDYPPFEEWRTSDAGKERLYDVIRQDLYRIQQE